MAYKGYDAVFFAALSLLLSGCQQDIVQKRANKLTSTVPTLYYEQIIDNLAISVANPDALPYFGIPTQGTHTNSRQYQASYTPGWDLISAGTAATSRLFGRYLFDKQTAALQGQVQNQEAFQLQPVSNPDKLFLMQAAYQTVTGKLSDQVSKKILDDYYETVNFIVDYHPYVIPGWFCVTKDKKVAEKNGCYVGHHEDIYVYVTKDHFDDFAKFTLAILDIASADTDYFYGVKKPPNSDSTSMSLAPRSKPIMPFPAPPVAPNL